ncbi:hypothetical protein OHA72_09990 [Dactylosporangium sp. NBC_01737]|uniref:hypothetical protein n=1 Tax=Dactylosporangium sp. NBC_01737 TaxID=2975959 RepID=UPI002E1362CC|nr:hypothetical protein OHA72_09990 [Dactylosporangium sp. NBC_01737]
MRTRWLPTGPLDARRKPYLDDDLFRGADDGRVRRRATYTGSAAGNDPFETLLAGLGRRRHRRSVLPRQRTESENKGAQL